MSQMLIKDYRYMCAVRARGSCWYWANFAHAPRASTNVGNLEVFLHGNGWV